MIIMIGGSRGFKDRDDVEKWVIFNLMGGDVLIHGACKNSPDVWAGDIAKNKGFVVGEFPYVDALGMSGGHARNRAMVRMADKCVFFWDGKSQGTGKTIQYAKSILKKVEVVTP